MTREISRLLRQSDFVPTLQLFCVVFRFLCLHIFSMLEIQLPLSEFLPDYYLRRKRY